MDNSLEKLMAAKTTDELQDILLDIKDYSASEVSLAISELQKRGKQFNEMQLDYLKKIIQRKQIDENPATPVYYSPKTIFTFSVFFTVLFGAILLALNLKERRNQLVSIGFGLTFMIFEITLVKLFSLGPVSVFLVNAIGSAILAQYFWNKYIGKNIPYKKKPIWLLILIAISLFVLFALVVIFNEAMRNAFKAGFEAQV